MRKENKLFNNDFQIIKMKDKLHEVVRELIFSDSFLEQELSAHSEKPLVVHEKTNQVTFVKCGRGKVILNEEIINIEKGDLIFIKKNVPHSFLTKRNIILLHKHQPVENGNDRVVLKRVAL